MLSKLINQTISLRRMSSRRARLFLRHPVGLDCHTLLRKVRNDEYGRHPEGGRATRRDPVELGYVFPGDEILRSLRSL